MDFPSFQNLESLCWFLTFAILIVVCNKEQSIQFSKFPEGQIDPKIESDETKKEK